MSFPIEEVLPAAINVVLVNPLPILAAILMVLSPKGQSAAPAFIVGWGIGMIAVLGLLLFVASPETVVGDQSTPSTLSSIVELLLGIILMFLAARQWQRRPKSGEKSAAPSWVENIQKATPVAALGLGAMMSGVNPKNLAFNIAAVVAIAQAHLTTGQRLISVAIYVLFASVGVALPVIWWFVDRERAIKNLTGWKSWLTANYTLITAMVLFLFGITLSSRGFGELIG